MLYNTKLENRENVARLAERIMDYFERGGKPVRVKVEAWQSKRSEDQQALIHIIIRSIANHVGANPEWFKQECIKRDCEGVYPFWPQKMATDLAGNKVPVPKSESELTKAEESDQIEHLYAFAAEWGVEVEDAA